MKVVTGHRIQPIRVSTCHVLMALALSLLVVAPATAKEAQGRTPQSPHTSVSSDGTTLSAAPLGMRSWTSQGFAGTGQTAPGTGLPGHPAPAGDVAPTSIIGADRRYQISNTTIYPYRAIAKITTSFGECTGWLISADTVATSGHCLFSNGTWASSVRVYPGRNGSSTPYGSCGATRLNSVLGWTRDSNLDYDYGAIKLDCAIGDSVGWFGFRWTSPSLTGQPAYTAGYPVDKTYGTLWRSDDQIRISQSLRLFYANDTVANQVGSPIWNNEASCSPCGVAIHARGVDGSGYNSGIRITQEVFNNLQTWRAS